MISSPSSIFHQVPNTFKQVLGLLELHLAIQQLPLTLHQVPNTFKQVLGLLELPLTLHQVPNTFKQVLAIQQLPQVPKCLLDLVRA